MINPTVIPLVNDAKKYQNFLFFFWDCNLAKIPESLNKSKKILQPYPLLILPSSAWPTRGTKLLARLRRFFRRFVGVTLLEFDWVEFDEVVIEGAGAGLWSIILTIVVVAHAKIMVKLKNDYFSGMTSECILKNDYFSNIGII